MNKLKLEGPMRDIFMDQLNKFGQRVEGITYLVKLPGFDEENTLIVITSDGIIADEKTIKDLERIAEPAFFGELEQPEKPEEPEKPKEPYKIKTRALRKFNPEDPIDVIFSKQMTTAEVRTRNPLARAGIMKISDLDGILSKKNREEVLLAIRMFGEKGMSVLKRRLKLK